MRRLGLELLAVGIAALFFVGISDYQGKIPGWAWPTAWVLLGVGLLTYAAPPIEKWAIADWIRLWWRQRRYAASTEPSIFGRWPEHLLVKRRDSGEASFGCKVTTPNDEIFTTEFVAKDQEAASRFPDDFVQRRPVRPPQLPDGKYEVEWNITERVKRFSSKRKLKSSFVVQGRPRWERVHHEWLPEDNGSVRLLWDGATPFGLRLRVCHPDTGSVYEMKHQVGFEVEGGVAVLFPDGFDGPMPPPNGHYEATWLDMPSSFYGEPKDAGRPVVVHEFTYPAGED